MILAKHTRRFCFARGTDPALGLMYYSFVNGTGYQTVDRAALALVAIVAWSGLVIQFYVTQTHPNLQTVSPVERTVRFFEYFTILTNTMVAVTTSVSLLARSTSAGEFFSRPSVRTAVAVYITLVGLVYNVILQGLHEFDGLALVADILTHDVVPVLYVVYWLIFVGKGEITWKMPFVWTIYPLVYVAYVLIRGSSTARYPYPFLDVTTLGLNAVILNAFGLAIVFLAVGEIFVFAGRVIARVTMKRTTDEA